MLAYARGQPSLIFPHLKSHGSWPLGPSATQGQCCCGNSEPITLHRVGLPLYRWTSFKHLGLWWMSPSAPPLGE